MSNAYIKRSVKKWRKVVKKPKENHSNNTSNKVNNSPIQANKYIRR